MPVKKILQGKEVDRGLIPEDECGQDCALGSGVYIKPDRRYAQYYCCQQNLKIGPKI